MSDNITFNIYDVLYVFVVYSRMFRVEIMSKYLLYP